MKILEQPFKGLYLIEINFLYDERGFLSKIFNSNSFNLLGIDFNPLEIFITTSKINVVRGMHLQLPPFDSNKLVFCSKGKALDVLVDLRPESETYKSVYSIILKEGLGLGVLIPPGVAHGFYSQEEGTILTYVTDTLYDLKFDGGIRWNSINFNWPCVNPVISNRDMNLPSLDQWDNPYKKLDINLLSKKKKKVLVTGATGFLGTNLVSRMLDLNWDVRVLLRTSSNIQKLDNRLKIEQIYIFDGNASALSLFLSGFNPDYVFHIAACTFYDYGPEQLDEIIDTNIKLGVLILELMKINNLKNFINTGTSWQHYKCSSYAPVNLYAATKQGFEDILDYYVKAHGFRVITLKLFDTYGPGDTRNKIFNLLINSGNKNEDLFVTSGEQVIDLVYINDVVNAYLAATYYFNVDFNFHLKYGLSSGERILLKDLINKITSKLNLKNNINFGEKKYRDREVFFPWNPPRGLPNWAPTPGALDNYLKLINE